MAYIVFASGKQILDAAAEGANRKFNRSTKDCAVYESMLQVFYERMLSDSTRKSYCDKARKLTKNNWRNAQFPLTLLMYHKHRAMQPCETHARICVMGQYQHIFDIPLEYWEMFEAQSKQYA
jgi:hypothetical protein